IPLCESCSGVDHRLFVARLVIAKIRILLQRLTDACYITVTEDAPHAGEERQFASVAFHILILEEPNERLGHRQSPLVHARPRIERLSDFGRLITRLPFLASPYRARIRSAHVLASPYRARIR